MPASTWMHVTNIHIVLRIFVGGAGRKVHPRASPHSRPHGLHTTLGSFVILGLVGSRRRLLPERIREQETISWRLVAHMIRVNIAIGQTLRIPSRPIICSYLSIFHKPKINGPSISRTRSRSTMAKAVEKSTGTLSAPRPPPITHILETCLMVKDIRASVDFYQDVFSIKPFLDTVSTKSSLQAPSLRFDGATCPFSPPP
jgi:hypothetical protein